MTISLYQASVPVFGQYLGGLRGVLLRGEAHAVALKVEPAVLLGARLYPDMFPLLRQVQVAADFARGAALRLAGREVPSWPDSETRFDELVARIDRTGEVLATLAPADIDGQEDRLIELKVGGTPATFTGLPYLLHFALPNFFFHVTTAYAILRHNGVAIGKRDFMDRR